MLNFVVLKNILKKSCGISYPSGKNLLNLMKKQKRKPKSFEIAIKEKTVFCF